MFQVLRSRFRFDVGSSPIGDLLLVSEPNPGSFCSFVLCLKPTPKPFPVRSFLHCSPPGRGWAFDGGVAFVFSVRFILSKGAVLVPAEPKS